MKNNQSQFAFRGVRSSKYRHIFGSPARRDHSYDNIKISRSAHDGTYCAANPKFVAVVTEVAGGGAFVVCPIEKTGRVDGSSRVTGHAGPVTDIKWSPFNDNVIASASDDCTVKVWHIPDGGLAGCALSQWLVELRGHTRRVTYLEWHPTAENVLFSAANDQLILVWDLGRGEVLTAIDCHREHIFSMSLNRDGSRLATTSKDKLLRIIEPRTGQMLQEGRCHEGAKACKVQYLGDSGRLLTTGFSRYSDRQYGVWDESDLQTPLRLETIDSSSGVLYPFYDHDTRVLFLAGKGDGNIRYYEMVDEAPWCHYLNQYISGAPQRGLGMLTKRACDTARCEIFRFFKLHATKDLVEPLSMIVPRKSDQFQEDIYPDTAAPTPALTAAEWMSGADRPPVLMSLRTVGVSTDVAVRTHKAVTTNRSEGGGLQTGDRNTDRKFAFISTVPALDYRPRQDRERSPDANKAASRVQQIQRQWSAQPAPAASLQEPLPDQRRQQTIGLRAWAGPTAAPSAPGGSTGAGGRTPTEPAPPASPQRQAPRDSAGPGGNRAQMSHTADSQLRRRYAEQAEEIKQLKNMLNIKEQRIRELEDQLDGFIKHNDSVA